MTSNALKTPTCILWKDDVNSSKENVCFEKLIRINLLKWIRRLVSIKLADISTDRLEDWFAQSWLTLLLTDFESLSKNDSANVNLNFSGAREICPIKLSKIENKSSENPACVCR